MHTDGGNVPVDGMGQMPIGPYMRYLNKRLRARPWLYGAGCEISIAEVYMVALTDPKCRQGIIVSGSADNPNSVHEIISIGATQSLGFDTNVEW